MIKVKPKISHISVIQAAQVINFSPLLICLYLYSNPYYPAKEVIFCGNGLFICLFVCNTTKTINGFFKLNVSFKETMTELK